MHASATNLYVPSQQYHPTPWAQAPLSPTWFSSRAFSTLDFGNRTSSTTNSLSTTGFCIPSAVVEVSCANASLRWGSASSFWRVGFGASTGCFSTGNAVFAEWTSGSSLTACGCASSMGSSVGFGGVTTVAGFSPASGMGMGMGFSADLVCSIGWVGAEGWSGSAVLDCTLSWGCASGWGVPSGAEPSLAATLSSSCCVVSPSCVAGLLSVAVSLAVCSEGSVWLESSETFDFPLILAINSSLLASWVGLVTEAGSGDLLLLLLETPTRSRGLFVSGSTIRRAFVARLLVAGALGCICVDGCCGWCGNFWLGACAVGRSCLAPPYCICMGPPWVNGGGNIIICCRCAPGPMSICGWIIAGYVGCNTGWPWCIKPAPVW